MIKKQSIQLFICAAAMLFWELVLIRWLSSSIRIVSYYTNFVLIAAFFGLGFGALLARHSFPLKRFLFPILSLAILSGLYLSGLFHHNPTAGSEFIWIGQPSGIDLFDQSPNQLAHPIPLLITAYILTSLVFVLFGQWIGHLFKNLPALKAYSIDIMGSLTGILIFGLFSTFQLSPTIWFIFGFLLLFIIIGVNKIDLAIGLFCAITVLSLTLIPIQKFIWSPYYKIKFEPINRIFDLNNKNWENFVNPIGYGLTVNNDYHQMMLTLFDQPSDHPFIKEWRDFYSAPYLNDSTLPDGPILIVGAGTGNDVSAALHNTSRSIDAVDIDQTIVGLGKKFHSEHPYENPRVTIHINDARSHFHNTKKKYAHIVFGFLDSHTLTSSFSSLRLDNFVYTTESLEEVKNLLLPGGQVSVSFASNNEWMHSKFIYLLTQTFGTTPVVTPPHPNGYPNGFIYQNKKTIVPPAERLILTDQMKFTTPTDDWPFLYLKKPEIPRHYILFLILITVLSFVPLLTLPKGERKIRLPFFFLGAAFFLIETTNVVSLSLLYGSTWKVNILVFSGILFLVLMGNLTIEKIKKPNIPLIFICLAASLIVAFVTHTSFLLDIQNVFTQGLIATFVYLGPVYFASLIFASLIKNETHFYQAYGSNVLGAVLGGAAEYFSLLLGFKFLIIMTGLLYLTAYVFIKRDDQRLN